MAKKSPDNGDLEISEHGARGLIAAQLSSPKVYKFVLTGGPCSGKTTAVERLQFFLRERGFRVFVVPEAATILFLNGASPDDLARPECQKHFQRFVISAQVSLEDEIMDYARSTGETSVVFCDRGVMDGSAYVDEATFDEVLKYKGLDVVSARDARYDAIFHLVTAADGAEKFYNLDNKARWESSEEARRLDMRTQKAWSGHPQHVIIDNQNSKSFDHKLERLISVISTYIGLPSLTRRSHKFVLAGPPDFSLLPFEMHVFEVEKVMLSESFRLDAALPSTDAMQAIASLKEQNGSSSNLNGTEARELYSFVRRRTQGKMQSFGLTTVKRFAATGEKMELKQVISNRMYNLLARSSDKTRHVVRQRRYCFLYLQQSFQIIEYLNPQINLWILRVQCEGEPKLPPDEYGLKVRPWDQDHEDFSSYSLSLKSRKSPLDRSNTNSPLVMGHKTPPLSASNSLGGERNSPLTIDDP